MVGIEVDSSDFVKAESALSGVMSAEALAAVRGAAAWANPKPEMQYASPAAAEPAAYGAAEPAVALFLGDDEALTQSSGSERPLLTLVTDNGEALSPEASALFNNIIALVTDKDEVASEDVRAEASELLSEIMSMDPEARAKVTGEIAALKNAKDSGKSSGIDFSAIRALIATAEHEAKASKAESAEQKRERLWNEIEALQEDTRERMLRLLREGKISQEDFDEWDSADKASRDPNLSQQDRVTATNTAAAAANGAVSGVAGADADGVRNNSKAIIAATDDIMADSRGADSLNNSTTANEIPANAGQSTNPVVAQAQAALSPTVIASYRGSQELTPPLETPPEAVVIAAANTPPRFRG